MRMIVAYRTHQVAAGRVQMSAKDQTGGRDVEAGPRNQPSAHLVPLQSRVTAERGKPDAVNLHHAVILGAVPVRSDHSRRTTLHLLNRWQHAWRKSIDLGDKGHARQVRNAHPALHRDGGSFPARSVSSKDSVGSDAEFTLLEILVVIAILGLLIGLVAPAALRQLGGARASVARQSIERLVSVLDLYRLDVGKYPTTSEGLQALNVRPPTAPSWNGPYLRGDAPPVDPWNRPYEYRSPSSRSGREFDLCSLGPNGTGSAEAICN